MRLQPDAFCPAVEEIHPAVLRRMGCALLLLDADNTLMPHGAAQLSPTVQKWIQSLQAAGLSCALLSNAKAGRAFRLAEQHHLPYIGQARKPSIWGVQEASRRFAVRSEEIILVGDQLFTDIWCAKRAGIRSILVRPLSYQEPFYIRFKRILERCFLPRACFRTPDAWPNTLPFIESHLYLEADERQSPADD